MRLTKLMDRYLDGKEVIAIKLYNGSYYTSEEEAKEEF